MFEDEGTSIAADPLKSAFGSFPVFGVQVLKQQSHAWSALLRLATEQLIHGSGPPDDVTGQIPGLNWERKISRNRDLEPRRRSVIGRHSKRSLPQVLRFTFRP